MTFDVLVFFRLKQDEKEKKSFYSSKQRMLLLTKIHIFLPLYGGLDLDFTVSYQEEYVLT